jgi:hypothetical protein
VSAFITLLDVDDEVGVFDIVGFVVVVGEVVIDVGAVDVLLATAGDVVVFEVKDGVVVNLFVDELKAGALFDEFLTTLLNGARSIPFASGNCFLEVRFFKIAMSYPVFFSNEDRPAILVTGLNLAVLGKVLGGIAPAL